MKTLYLDCSMGAAGDMLAGALLELVPDPEGALRELNQLGIPDVQFLREESQKCGIRGTHFSVLVHGVQEGPSHPHTEASHSGHHPHAHLSDILDLVDRLALSETVRKNISEVYHRIAQAESLVHGIPVSDIHFHEVGTLDAIADITAVCLLMERLAPVQVIASPVCVGSGQVQCAHGILSVPAPATAELLRGVPIYSGRIQSELCTPTGAALLRQFAVRFGEMPILCPEKIGYGMGRKDFAQANCLRAILGADSPSEDDILELSCNLDDMRAEDIGFASEQLLSAGALDVFTVPIGMKKSRPGALLCVLCRPENREQMVKLLFCHTTTLGIREKACRRAVLARQEQTVDTPCGTVRKKISTGYGICREKWEYEDLARIAREEGRTLEEVREQLP